MLFLLSVNKENNHLRAPWKLKLLFDGDCPFCKREIAWMSKRNKNGYLAFEDIASLDFDPASYGLTEEEVMGVIHGVFSDGRIIKKVEVFIEAYRLLGFGWLVAPLSWPIIRSVANMGYEIFARYRVPFGNFLGARSCGDNSCRLPKEYPHQLIFRRAEHRDLPAILKLLIEDELGKTRESMSEILEPCYEEAFQKITTDSNHDLMVVEDEGNIIGTCHLTLLPSLTFRGTTRLQVESVRVAEFFRERGIGKWMFQKIFEYAKHHQISMIQLTTNKNRKRAKKFYERLGFEATHEGMKMTL
jgi:predicted DCC family thiol-disulfide oxidoreductase YuxK/ribosomal protein S18 acetylase RimI-like enzyme